jgi:hypothetical protein
VNILIWHVHGSWTTSFVQGGHTYLVPVVADRGPDGRGRARTWDWPATVIERTPLELRDDEIDLVILQRPHDERLFEEWTRRRAGRDVPAVWLEHNAPQGRIAEMRHPAADRDDLVVVHVTHANELFWDCGATTTTVIEHGIVDPGYRYRGDVPSAAVVVNDPLRRGRVTGTDLLARFADVVPLDVFGMQVAPLASDRITVHEDLPQAQLHDELARRRAYLHPVRWTSLGLSLLEAMHLGMPVVALSTTEVPEAVPVDAGVVSNRLDVLEMALRRFLHDPEEAAGCGKLARDAALERYGLARFLADWDRLMEEVS